MPNEEIDILAKKMTDEILAKLFADFPTGLCSHRPSFLKQIIMQHNQPTHFIEV